MFEWSSLVIKIKIQISLFYMRFQNVLTKITPNSLILLQSSTNSLKIKYFKFQIQYTLLTCKQSNIHCAFIRSCLVLPLFRICYIYSELLYVLLPVDHIQILSSVFFLHFLNALKYFSTYNIPSKYLIISLQSHLLHH